MLLPLLVLPLDLDPATVLTVAATKNPTLLLAPTATAAENLTLCRFLEQLQQPYSG